MRFLPVFGALVLCACSTDVFVTPDAAADGGDGGTVTGDSAPPLTIIKCNNTTCTGHTCCAPFAGWDVTSCAAASTEGQPTCARFLECDDVTDCAAGQVCCAQQAVDGVTGKELISSAKCASTCTSSGTQVQLCNTDNECLQGNCQNNQGNPTWLKTCQ